MASLIIITTVFLVIIPSVHANDCYGRGGFVVGYLSCASDQDDDHTLPLASEFGGDISIFNRCTSNQICLGNFENEIKVLLYCDMPSHGCLTAFDESELYGCADNEIYAHGVCMTLETKERAEAIGEIDVEPELEDVSTFNYKIESDGVTYGSQYEITGGIVDKITYDSHSNSLIISLNESKKGYITIVIQTGLLHSFDQLPFTYFVIADGEEVLFEQPSPIVLKIPFEKDTEEIEIIGTLW